MNVTEGPTFVRGSSRIRQWAVGLLGAVGLLALPGSQAVVPIASHPIAAVESQQAQTYNNYPTVLGAPIGPSYAAPTAPATWPAGAGVRSDAPTSFDVSVSGAAPLATSGIPLAAYRAYLNAATELGRVDPACRISWTLIAGIGRIESNHGRFGGSTIRADGLVTPPILGIRLDGSHPGTARVSDSDGGRYDGDPVFDRAVGPMQFLPGTWEIYGGGADPQNMNAAALAAGRYLCAGGRALDTTAGRWAAVYRYNQSAAYVSLVLSLADSYATGRVAILPSGGPTGPGQPTHPPTTSPAAHPTTPAVTAPTTGPTTTTTPTPSATSEPPTPTTTPTTAPTTTPTTAPTTTPTTTTPTTAPTTTTTSTPTTTPTTSTTTTTPTTSTSPSASVS